MDEDDDVIVSTIEALPTEREIQADLEDRKTFLGGSDAPVILGLSAWKTRYELWQEKTGQVEQADLSLVERVQMGILLEDVVAKRAEQKYCWKLHRINGRLLAKNLPYPAVAQIDRRLVGQDAIVEIKTTDASMSAEWGVEDTPDVPPAYYAQVQHQMMVAEKYKAWIVVLIGGNKVKRYLVLRDEEFIENLKKAEESFWRSVLERIPPEPITLAEAGQCWKKAPAAPVFGTPIHAAQAAEYLALSDEINMLETRRESVRLELEREMRDIGDSIVVQGKTICTWKNQSRTGIDTKKLEADHPGLVGGYKTFTEFRTFRVTKEAMSFRTFGS
jgi:putative phage-type endonuclease